MTAAPRALAAVLLAVLALLGAGCSGGDGATGAAGTTATTATTGGETAAAADEGTPDAEPGKILLSFVRAAGKGNAEGMWKLLTEPTQASIGPTLEDFRADAAINLQAGLGTIASTAKVILSRRLADNWAAAAVAGDRIVKGEKEHFAYGAALLSENGKLKLELGGVVIAGYKPDPTSEIEERQPTVAASVGAGGDLTDVRMWLDGRAFPATRGANDTPFTATLRGKPAKPLAAGLHTVVAFAATSDTATASAWAFTVK